MTSKISDLLEKMNKVISEDLLDKEGYIKIEHIENFMSNNNPAQEVLISFLKNEKFKIKCINLEDFFFSLETLFKILTPQEIVSRIEPNTDLLEEELFDINTMDMEEFFRTLPKGFGIIIDLILRDISERYLIEFLNRFSSLELLVPTHKDFEKVKVIKTVLNYAVNKGSTEDYHKAKQLIEKNQKLFPLLYLKVQSTYRVNQYITLKLENNQTNIYIKGELFNQCKYLLLNIPTKKIKDYDQIDSIDEAAEVNKLSRALEGGSRRKKFDISAETEFWGHCSNIQAWTEHKYDTRLLHRNLAFPLLQKLAEVGDPLAKKSFRKEILKRLSSGHSTVITYLSDMGYLENITEEDYHELLRKPDYDLAENLIRGLANPKHSKYVKPIFLKMMEFLQEDIKDYAVRMLKNLDVELYCGLKITGYFDSIGKEQLEVLLNNPDCILKEFHYKFRGADDFIAADLSIDLSDRGINELSEIEGLHRLKHLKTLNLQDNNLRDVFGLENLNNLTKLRLKGNLLNQRLLESLGGLNKQGDAIEPYKFVEYCQKNAHHQIEHVEHNELKYEVINGILNLSKLNIENLEDIKGLFDLNNLTHLNLSFNKLKDVDDILLLKSLVYLNLSHNKIERFSGFEALEDLKVIRLNGNKGCLTKEIPNFKIIKNKLDILDLDTSRIVHDKEYLIYLLQPLTISDMIGLCKQFNIRGYSQLSREKLIKYIPQSLLEFETRDAIRKVERDVIANGLKNAIISLKSMFKKEDYERIQINLIGDTIIEIITKNWDNRKIKSTLHINPSSLDNPNRHCQCKIGRRMGFCTHFWYGFIFAFKAGFFQLSEWTLTILPKNLEDFLDTIQIFKKKPNEYRFIDKESITVDEGFGIYENYEIDLFSDAMNIHNNKKEDKK